MYQLVKHRYVTLDGLDDCSLDDLDEMNIAHEAIERALNKPRK